MNIYTKLFLILLVPIMLFVYPNLGLAQVDGETYTLKRIISTALLNNRELMSMKEKLIAQDWSVKKAYSNFLPKADITQRLTRVDDISVRNANFSIEGLKSFPGFEDVDIPPFLYKDTYQTTLNLRMPIFNAGENRNELQLAKLNRENEKLNFEDFEDGMIKNVTNDYYNYIKSTDLIKIMEKSFEQSKKTLETIKNKYELGLRPRSDLLRWEAQHSNDESNLLEAQNNSFIAKANLAQTMGIDILSEFNVADVSDTDMSILIGFYNSFLTGSFEKKLNTLYNIALENSHTKKSIGVKKKISQNSINKAKSNFLPKINFAYNYNWQANDTPKLDGFKQWDASINLSYSLFNGFGDTADIQKAKAELKSAELEEQSVDRSLKVLIYSAYKNIQTALSKISLFEKNLVQTEENLSELNNRFELELSSNLELIDAQLLQITAETNLLSSKYDLLIAGAEIDRALGKPLMSTNFK